MNTAPKHPTQNPSIPAAIYDAIVEQIAHHQYAGDQNHVVVVNLLLPELGKKMTTNIYLPFHRSEKAQQRLWYFATGLGLEPRDLFEEPGMCRGRKLRIQVRKLQDDASLVYRQYCDVELFLPPVDEQELNRELGMPMVPHSGLRNETP